MKTFRHKLGHFVGKTMTIAELRAKIIEYPDDMPIMVNYEGCNSYVEPEYFDVEKMHKGHLDDECDVLIISLYDY